MIPVKLEIQGLYSYKDTQVIDFEQLTAAGLFGIFGAVGSGKSSILEAIMLALYGSTERLSDRGEKNSMLNLQRDHLLINFEFKGGRNNSQRFLARYSAKRNKKNFDDVRPAEHTFYELLDGNTVPLEQRGEAIVGMKKEHFKQTVIIPQGKFRDFIDLTPGPRADMMKELFGLERFDLAPKTGSLLKAVREDKIRLETQLSAFTDLNPAAVAQKMTTLEELKTVLHSARESLEKTEANFRRQEGVQKSYQHLLEFKKEWQTLEKRFPEIEEKKNTGQEVAKAKTYLRPLWESLSEENKELEKYRVSVIDCARFRENFEREIKVLEEDEKSLREKAENRPDRENKIRDLTKVLEIQKLHNELEQAEKGLETLRPELETLEAAQFSFDSRIKNLEQETDNLTVSGSIELAERKGDAKDWTHWEGQLKQLETEMGVQASAVKTIQDSIQEILKQLPDEVTDFDTWKQSQHESINRLEILRERVMQRQGLGSHAHLLISGEPCPLCGSKDHPSPIELQAEEDELRKCHSQIKEAKHLLDQIVTSSENLAKQKIRLEHQEALFAEKEKESHRTKLNLEVLQKKMADLGMDSLEALKIHVATSEKGVLEKERMLNEIKSLRKKSEQNKVALENTRKKEQKFNQQTLGVSTSISTKTEEIKDPVFCKPFYGKDSDLIQATIQKVKRDIEETAFKLESKRKVLQETRTKQATNLANLDHFTALRDKTAEKIKALENEFVDSMEKHGFADKEKLVALFGSSLDTDRLDREIRQFEDRCLLVKNKMEDLKQEPGVKEFDVNAFNQLQDKLDTEKKLLHEKQQAYTVLEQQILDDASKLKQKEVLEKTFEELSQRESHLRELNTLFQGSGFVKYVSGIYLKELCNTANMRFRKLTKNSLSLEIDDSNTFWVIDYLNGGKKRLLKTLSGGQTFQASLCLALALAEKVKALNQADQSFFFLDEGFGALDRNSLRVVFETLKSLRQENRIVGIISHVEELQQEIEVYAKVSLDPEVGSQVSYSFK
jgi:exonuclease SbcC